MHPADPLGLDVQDDDDDAAEGGAAGAPPLLAGIAAPAQVAPLPPPPGLQRQRTFAHSHTCVAVLLRPAKKAAAAAPEPPPWIVQQDGSRATHGGKLAAITERVLRRLSQPRPLAAAAAADAAAADAASRPIPIAHLGAYCFPGTTSEFIIFEPRYRLLFYRAIEAAGAAAAAGGADGAAAAGGAVATGRCVAVGVAEEQLATLVSIEWHEELLDGRLRVGVRGLRRFAHGAPSVLPGSFGLWRAQPTRWIDDEEPCAGSGAGEAAAADAVEGGAAAAAALAPALEEEFEAAVGRQGWSLSAIERAGGQRPPAASAPAALSWWYASVLPAPADVKTRWFTSVDAAARMRDVLEWTREAL